jgi:hypothetical protein
MFNILIDIVPARYRKVIYALVALLALLFSIWQASNGNWEQFIFGVIASLTTTTASVNTIAQPLYAAGSIVNPDDGKTYEEAGGSHVPTAQPLAGLPEDTGVYDPGTK